MKLASFVLLVCVVFVTTPFALAQTAPAEAVPVSAPFEFGLQDGTPIKLRLNRNMSSADAKTGETVDFEVLEDVKVGEMTVISKGGVALGTVTRAKPKGRLGKGGKLDINIDSVMTAAGEKLPLRAVKQSKGYSSTAPMTGAIVAAGILFFPAAPFFLFLKGKDIKIPKGTEVTAYINGNSPLDRNKFAAANSGVPNSSEIASTPPIALDDMSASLQVKSSPDGAEIFVNGDLVGGTPSSFVLKAGEHNIVIKKPGFQPWERKISLLGGSRITLDAALEKVQ